MSEEQLEMDLQFVRMEFENGKLVKKFNLDLLLPSKDLRRVITPQNDITADLKEFGQEKPILIADLDGRYMLVDGRKRVICARRLGWPTLMALVRKMSLEQAMLMTARANNVRSSNELTDIDAIRQLMDTYPSTATDKTISHYTGIPVGTVKKLKRMAKLDARLIASAHEGLISVTTLNDITKVPGAERHALETIEERAREYEQGEGIWKSGKTGKILDRPPVLFTADDVKDVQRVAKANMIESLPLQGFKLPERRQGYAAMTVNGDFLTSLQDTAEEVALAMGGTRHILVMVKEVRG
jgi:ParB/RepB/Spo0J family partition protein